MKNVASSQTEHPKTKRWFHLSSASWTKELLGLLQPRWGVIYKTQRQLIAKEPTPAWVMAPNAASLKFPGQRLGCYSPEDLLPSSCLGSHTHGKGRGSWQPPSVLLLEWKKMDLRKKQWFAILSLPRTIYLHLLTVLSLSHFPLFPVKDTLLIYAPFYWDVRSWKRAV